jgi:phthiodiolone/phenolphthiodiolone dimycocerosates ketoreductase
MPDHTVGFGIRRWNALDAWTVIPALAMETSRIKLGSCVSDTYRRHPCTFAQMVTTCDIISKGRVVLGIGVGEAMNLNPFGVAWDEPLMRTREAILVVKKLWTEDVCNYDGTYYRLRNAFLQPKPIQKPHPPMWIAANAPDTMRLVAELGDGWVPASIFPDEYAKGLEMIRKWAEEANRDPMKIAPAIFTFTVIAEDYDTARRTIMLPAKIYFTTRPRILRKIGYEEYATDEFDMTRRLVFSPEVARKLLERAKKLPDDVIDDAPVFFGSPEDVIEGIDKYVKVGARHFVLNFFVRPEVLRDNLKMFAEKVMPYFKAVR